MGGKRQAGRFSLEALAVRVVVWTAAAVLRQGRFFFRRKLS